MNCDGTSTSIECHMVRTCHLGLWNHVNEWVIGTPPGITCSERFSAQIQMKYNNHRIKKPDQPTTESYHKHLQRAEEYYLVLDGSLKVKVDGQTYHIGKRQILAVPPMACHMVTYCSPDVEYLTIRAPYSHEATKIDCAPVD